MTEKKPEEKKVKGTMLVDQVRMIRKFKDLDWSEYLIPEDWKIINSNVMDAAWYPLEVYRRLGYATFMVLARGDVEVVRARGRARGREIFDGIYKSLIVEGDPAESLGRFTSRYDLLFNFSSLKLVNVDDESVEIHHTYSADDPSNVPYCYQMMGHLDTLVEMAGASDVSIRITDKQWQGAPSTVFVITWK